MDWSLDKVRHLIAADEGHAVLQLAGGGRKNDDALDDESSNSDVDIVPNYPYTVLVTFSGEYLVADTKELKQKGLGRIAKSSISLLPGRWYQGTTLRTSSNSTTSTASA